MEVSGTKTGETITERALIIWISTHLYVVEIYKNNQNVNNSR
jgi:hypothetical protein